MRRDKYELIANAHAYNSFSLARSQESLKTQQSAYDNMQSAYIQRVCVCKTGCHASFFIGLSAALDGVGEEGRKAHAEMAGLIESE